MKKNELVRRLRQCLVVKVVHGKRGISWLFWKRISSSITADMALNNKVTTISKQTCAA